MVVWLAGTFDREWPSMECRYKHRWTRLAYWDTGSAACNTFSLQSFDHLSLWHHRDWLRLDMLNPEWFYSLYDVTVFIYFGKEEIKYCLKTLFCLIPSLNKADRDPLIKPWRPTFGSPPMVSETLRYVLVSDSLNLVLERSLLLSWKCKKSVLRLSNKNQVAMMTNPTNFHEVQSLEKKREKKCWCHSAKPQTLHWKDRIWSFW